MPSISDEELSLYEQELFAAPAVLTAEQNAIYSLFSEDEGSVPGMLRRMREEAEDLEDVERSGVGDARHAQREPCVVDTEMVQRRMESVRRRRRRVAAESGVPTETSASSGRVHALMHRLETQRRRDGMRDSLMQTRIVSVAEEASRREGCAMTRNVREVGVPFVYGVREGLQEAFWRVERDMCPRCRRMCVREANGGRNGGLCERCYVKVFVEVGFGRGDEGGVMRREEREKEEMRVVGEIEAMRKYGKYGTPATDRGAAVFGQGNVIMTAVSTDAAETPAGKSGDARRVEIGTNGGNGVNAAGGAGDPPLAKGIESEDGWNVHASDRALRTINPIRNLVQNIAVNPPPGKPLIKLSIGDPTTYGNLPPPQEATDAFVAAIRSGKANGYSLSMGTEAARRAVAERYSTKMGVLECDDVILTSGTSGALELVLGAIANEGDNVLLPQPGFPLFRTIAEGHGIECRYYTLDAESNWEIRLGDLAKIADSRTKAILVNNPSNPCGSVFSAAHIQALLAVAGALRLPIVADEVYADMVFSKEKFTSIASESVDVPVLSVGGISKQFVVPGWRTGWVTIHDRENILGRSDIRKGLRQLTTRMLVPNTPVQHVIPALLQQRSSDNEAFCALMKTLEQNAEFTMKSLASAKGLRCIRPQGAMYLMVEIDVELLGFKDDMAFVKGLLDEEGVFVLPGEPFLATNYVRIVFAAPREKLGEAYFRIRSFCGRHAGGM